jgi:Cys-tRNA(Pro)/Cys-tRNA(Cys) deacylase
MAGHGGTRATDLLARSGIPHTVHRYTHDPRHPSYGQEASEALGVPPERVFKTLVADVDGTLTVAVVPVAGSLDLKALATALGGKKAVFCSAGQRGLEIELAPSDLVATAGAQVAPIART